MSLKLIIQLACPVCVDDNQIAVAHGVSRLWIGQGALVCSCAPL